MAQDQMAEGTGGKRQQRRAQIAATLAQYRSSGLSQVEFARQAGIKLCSLRNWLYRGRRARWTAGHGGFAAVQLAPARPRGGAITIRWPHARGSVEVEVPATWERSAVAGLLRELLGACSA